MWNLIINFFTTAIGGIVGAEGAAAKWQKQFAQQGDDIANLMAANAAAQDAAETQIASEYEQQLKKESRTQQLKAVGVSLLMILLVLAFLYLLNKTVK